MPLPKRIIGLPEGAADVANNEMHFTLQMAEGRPIKFVAKYGIAAQVIAALGRLMLQLQDALRAAEGTVSAAAEQIRSSHVQKNAWSDQIVMQLTTPEGVPYTFALSRQAAISIADQLKSESAKVTRTGTA